MSLLTPAGLPQPPTTRRRRFLPTILVLAIFAGGYAIYQHSQTTSIEQDLTQARNYWAEGNFNTATLALRRMIRKAPDNPDAFRLLATILEAKGIDDAVLLRKKVVQLCPDSRDDQLLLAATAIKFDLAEVAKHALSSPGVANEEDGRYLELFADVLVKTNHFTQATDYYMRALQRTPDQHSVALKLGRLLTQSQSLQERNAGMLLLQKQAHSPINSLQALRALAKVTAIHNASSQLTFTTRLAEHPNATFKDKLILLSTLKRLQNPNYQHQLITAKNEAINNTADTLLLMSWMNLNGMSDTLLTWAENALPSETLHTFPQLAAYADALAETQQWETLKAVTSTSAIWPGFEHMRQLGLARASRGLGDEVSFNVHWEKALTAAKSDPRALAQLVNLVRSLQWQDKLPALAWATTEVDPAAAWPAPTLLTYYQQNEDTQGLYRLAQHNHQRHPDNPDAKNRLAMLSLLLNSGTHQALQLSASLHSEYPDNDAFTSTYAFALLANQRPEKAKEVMQSLPQPTLETADYALYYGLILAECGASTKKIRHYLQRTSSANSLPEEQALREAALEAL